MSVRLVWPLAIAAGCVSAPVPSSGGHLPSSTSVLEVPTVEVALSADAGGFRLDGTPVAGADADGALAAALDARVAELRARAARDPAARAFTGTITVEFPATHRVGSLVAAIGAASRAGFESVWLVVAGRSGDPRAISFDGAEVSMAEAGRQDSSARPPDRGSYANPRVLLDPAVGVTVLVHDRVVDPGGGLVLACSPPPCEGPSGSAWPWVELNRLARRIKLDHARDRGVLVAPSPDISVQSLVHALDALRDDHVVARGEREIFPVAMLAAHEGEP